MSSNDLAVKAENLHKTYRMGTVDLHVLRGVSVSVSKGEFVSIVGASGSGKSTLLHLVGLLDRADKGSVLLEGVDTNRLPARRRNRMRCRDIGFVFQFYYLLPELNVLENVMLPAKVEHDWLSWMRHRGDRRRQALEVLDRMGLADRLKHRSKELSGGERQRVAIARALINRPRLLLADEPTGNLDSKTGRQIMSVLRQFNKDAGQTILMVTHDAALAKESDRVLHLVDGRLAD